VDAAGAAHLFPRSISNVLSIFDFEINISDVHGSGGTILAASNVSRIADNGGPLGLFIVSLKLVRKSNKV
jgi:hypothetical protein